MKMDEQFALPEKFHKAECDKKLAEERKEKAQIDYAISWQQSLRSYNGEWN